MTTATTKGARDHARAQAGQITDAMPVLPASNWPWTPEDVDPLTLTWAETIPGGRYAGKVLGRGTRLRLTDVTGSACVSVVLLRADAPWERLNVADTVKVPWQAYLGTGHPLLSDQGRVLATIVADSSGHHDTFCGTSTLTANAAKYGAGDLYSKSPAGRELFTLAAAKHGLAPRDIGPSVSFFHGVRAGADGALHSVGTAGPGAAVDLLIHLPVIVLLANTAHPLDPSQTFDTGPAQVLAWPALDELVDLPNNDPEYQRAVLNTEDAWAAAQNGEML
ncbi:Urea carboxylase-associated protein 2 [Mycolicibacterium phlei]|uniref:urea amidolyase associated protein UAAP1 n=1 Tax=Mycobacteroides chelonae TaxID=1774 RepID=UPI000618D4BF|nr:urea amidolyase associated protein UAAP1 [Mycobacteroides chelonae]VEG19997.1 Urea carboxylase-associated protein 2 [Mycolicibacterium phlei]AKC40418.1 urea carboxylase [Mycobacteroides chelonae]ANB00070.1 urea carboxylase [Mycobacteroides chelonae CCUG 47445]OLT82165.1 urea carboxylase [Mycobacteroides chelonae]ORV15724.1 urea carboxylase [Mycobacteroides chelonae]